MAKLLYCPDCGDLFNLDYSVKMCRCRRVWGQYVNRLDVLHSGGVPVCIDTNEFAAALENHSMFSAWVPKNHGRFQRLA